MKLTKAQKSYFTTSLMRWHAADNDRSLPWKQEKDPYKIWLSEIILQQTRAEQGKPYYLKFIEAFPTVKDMAAADDETVYRLWQGLGYYNRCKNMLATARYIYNELNGNFPRTYEGLLALKGIGPYTAAAIASFAFGLPCAVVDGNVYRVLSRYFGIDTPFDTAEGKTLFRETAKALLDQSDSAGYNQAIMDLGATICKPALPLCGSCPLQRHCIAFKQGLIADLPVRSKKMTVKKRYFHYIMIMAGESVWLHKREGKDIWQNLYEPYLIEEKFVMDQQELLARLPFKKPKVDVESLAYEGHLMQRLTHQLVETHFYVIQLPKPAKVPLKEGNWVLLKDLGKLAFPKTLVSFLEKKLYF